MLNFVIIEHFENTIGDRTRPMPKCKLRPNWPIHLVNNINKKNMNFL